MELKQVEKISKALGDVNRLKILQQIQRHQGQLECNDIANFLNLAQPSISHHIKKLVDSELISAHKEGRYYSYSLNEEIWDRYMAQLKGL